MSGQTTEQPYGETIEEQLRQAQESLEAESALPPLPSLNEDQNGKDWEAPEPPDPKPSLQKDKSSSVNAPVKEKTSFFFSKTFVFMALLLFCLLAGTLLLLKYSAMDTLSSRETPAERMEGSESVVPVEHVTEKKIDLLFPAQSGEDKKILMMEIELTFKDIASQNHFEENEILFRDAAYHFLKGQRPQKNSYKYWQKILEKDLQAHLQAAVPDGGLTSLRLDYMYKL